MTIEEIRKEFISKLVKSNIIKDGDKVGSNISVLLDIMAYIKYHIVITTNLTIKNILLPSTTVYRNAAAFAKNILGYKISSPVGATATITLKTDSDVDIYVPPNTKLKGNGFTFYTTKGVTVNKLNDVNVNIKEGVSIDKTVDSSLSFTATKIMSEFIIPYEDIELDSVIVKVNDVILAKVNILLNLGEGKYFSDYYIDGQHWVKLVFSELDYGKNIQEGDKVDISFNIVKGVDGNGISSFSFVDDIGVDVKLTAMASNGGSAPESLESIQTNAPKKYNTGAVTITTNDYESVLEEMAVVGEGTAWGGEEEFPQELGHINVTWVTPEGHQPQSSHHEKVLSDLNKKKIISTAKNIRQPQFIYIDFEVNIIGQLNQNTLVAKQEKIREIINNFYKTRLKGFRKPFFGSRLIREIDALFLNEDSVTVDVKFKPKMLISQLIHDKKREGETFIRTYLPNALVRYKMAHKSNPNNLIDIPDSNKTLSDLLTNGWKIFHLRENPININFGGIDARSGHTITAAPMSFNLPGDSTTLKNMGFYGVQPNSAYDPDALDKKIILHGQTIGRFSNMLSCLEFEVDKYYATAIKPGHTEPGPEEDLFISLDYKPYFNVVGINNSYWKMGKIRFV